MKIRFCFPTLTVLAYFGVLPAAGQEILDNRDTCAHPVVNCDPNEDHFATKITLEHVSSVTRLEYANTHVLLEQSWPTRGPWMQGTDQKVVFVRCGCPVPELDADWLGANVIHVPVSTVMVQMPSTLSKMYLMGQRSKVTVLESAKYLTDGTPEAVVDIRDGNLRTLDRNASGQPSTMVTLSFSSGTFADSSKGFRLNLTKSNCVANDGSCVLGQTTCIFPALDNSADALSDALSAFNSIPEWSNGGQVWVLTSGDYAVDPTSLYYEIFFDSQLSSSLELVGETSSCGGDQNISVHVDRDVASSSDPIYYRLHNMPGGFPDVLITEPRSLGPLADDPKVRARQFLDSDPGEESPLGRAELMKLSGLIVGSEDTANSLFELIEARYMNAKALALKAAHRPTVMVGKPGTWNEAARNSWMITVGSTHIGELLRDANVEYRNSDDSVQTALCGSGCGVCPSGTSDTRCSIDINAYLDLFQWADYWIPAGVGANCWSASCDFQITADSLLDENRNVFGEFLAMRCGSILALDQAHGEMGNTYWDIGRFRPDLLLEDVVNLVHPDVDVTGTTTFLRMLPAASNLTGVEACPRNWLPPMPTSGTVYVAASFSIDANPPSNADFVGAPEFVILDKFYSTVNVAIAAELGVEMGDMEIRMLNTDTLGFCPFVVRVAVSNCEDHTCGIPMAEKLESIAPAIFDALAISWISNVKRASSTEILLTDDVGDRVPLSDLERLEASPTSDDENSKTGLIAGISVAAALVFVAAIFITDRRAFTRGTKSKVSADSGIPEMKTLA